MARNNKKHNKAQMANTTEKRAVQSLKINAVAVSQKSKNTRKHPIIVPTSSSSSAGAAVAVATVAADESSNTPTTPTDQIDIQEALAKALEAAKTAAKTAAAARKLASQQAAKSHQAQLLAARLHLKQTIRQLKAARVVRERIAAERMAALLQLEEVARRLEVEEANRRLELEGAARRREVEEAARLRNIEDAERNVELEEAARLHKLEKAARIRKFKELSYSTKPEDVARRLKFERGRVDREERLLDTLDAITAKAATMERKELFAAKAEEFKANRDAVRKWAVEESKHDLRSWWIIESSWRTLERMGMWWYNSLDEAEMDMFVELIEEVYEAPGGRKVALFLTAFKAGGAMLDASTFEKVESEEELLEMGVSKELIKADAEEFEVREKERAIQDLNWFHEGGEVWEDEAVDDDFGEVGNLA